MQIYNTISVYFDNLILEIRNTRILETSKYSINENSTNSGKRDCKFLHSISINYIFLSAIS